MVLSNLQEAKPKKSHMISIPCSRSDKSEFCLNFASKMRYSGLGALGVDGIFANKYLSKYLHEMHFLYSECVV